MAAPPDYDTEMMCCFKQQRRWRRRGWVLFLFLLLVLLSFILDGQFLLPSSKMIMANVSTSVIAINNNNNNNSKTIQYDFNKDFISNTTIITIKERSNSSSSNNSSSSSNNNSNNYETTEQYNEETEPNTTIIVIKKQNNNSEQYFDSNNEKKPNITMTTIETNKSYNTEQYITTPPTTPTGTITTIQKEQDISALPSPPTIATRKEKFKKSSSFNQTEYDMELQRVTIPFPNVSTVAYCPMSFYSGYRNQGMVFNGFVLSVLEGVHKNHSFSQILLDSIGWKDQFGTNYRIRHERLFDVVHWNSFHPKLPRFVKFDAKIHTDLNATNNNKYPLHWNIEWPVVNATKPYAFPKRQNQMFSYYRHYTKLLMMQQQQLQRNPAEVLILQGAFRPHPALQEMINDFLKTVIFEEGKDNGEDEESLSLSLSLLSSPSSSSNNNYNHTSMSASSKKKESSLSFMALHARVEPDMQKHPVCRDKKVLKLQDIFNMLYTTFQDEPPVSKIIIMLGRHLLEQEDPKENEIAAENLRVLNDAIQNGLWGGRVKVVEAGTAVVQQQQQQQQQHNEKSTENFFALYAPSISGSIVNYFLALEAEIFVGTEVSSFSNDIQTTRFVRGKMKNYKYVPGDRLVLTTPEGTRAPPFFNC